MKNFIAQEFLPKEVFNHFQDKYNNGALGLRYINKNIVPMMLFLRDYFKKPIVINNWYQDGPFNGRTLRLPDNAAYTPYSDHTYGNAIDFNIPGIDIPALYVILLLEIPNTLKTFNVTSIEEVTMTPTWIHLGFADMTGWGNENAVNGIKIIRP